MKCKKCGTELKQGEFKCPNCNTKNRNIPVVLPNPKTLEVTKPIERETKPTEKKQGVSGASSFIRNNKKTVLIIALFMALLLIVTIIIIVASVRNNDDTDTSPVSLTQENTVAEDIVDETTTQPEPEYTTVNVPAIAEKVLNVNQAKIDTYNGNITREDQEDNYTFTAPRDGTYYFGLSEIHKGLYVNMELLDSLGETVCNEGYAENGDGMTAKELEANQTYTVSIHHNTGTGPYILSVCNQKKKLNVSEITKVVDSIDFTDQVNVYKFVAPRDGRYRFEFSEVYNDVKFNMELLNHLGEEIERSVYIGNEDGMTVEDVVEGEEYELRIKQSENTGSYQLYIWPQKNTVNVSEKTIVHDSIQFVEQKNTYYYEIKDASTHTITISGLENCSVNILAYNKLGECIESNYGVHNDYSIEVEEECTICIEYCDGITPYKLTID